MNDLLGGRYRLGEALGRGGMGTVYEAVQENLGRRVAVKLLDERLSFDREQLERFRREAEIVASLGHPNIVQVTDFQYPEELGKQPFLVMELLRGESLGSLLAREQVLTAQRAAFVAAQVLSALVAAHRAGVVHRDIKPDNIFLLADAAVPDTVKVLDFGIAKMSVEGQHKLTGTGAMLGTPAFMAPEQARGAIDVDARADVYAVGATMYQALSGKLPYEAPSIPALLFAIVEKTPAPLSELRPDLPRDLVAVVERAMAKNRDDRFPGADAMRRALAPWSGLPASIPPPISATAATIASGKIPPLDGATPIVVHRTPAPPSKATATSPSEPERQRQSARGLIALVVIIGMVMTAGVFITAIVTKGREPRDRATTTSSSAITPASAFTSASASATIDIAPHPIASVSAPAIPSASATRIAPAKKQRYGGNRGFVSSWDYGGCATCDGDAYKNDVAMKHDAVAACFAASEYEAPNHENVDFELGVSADGKLVVRSAQDGAPRLDHCLTGILLSTTMKMTSPVAGSFKVSFRGECDPGWTGHCN